MTDHLLKEKAPISEAAWAAIEDEARQRLKTHLAARKLVDFSGPAGWSLSSIELGRKEALQPPAEGVVASRRRVQPLVELRSEFSVSRTELDDVDRGALDVDLDDLVRAARQIAWTENRIVFHGYEAASVEGVLGASGHDPLGIDGDFERYPNVVAQAVDVLRQAGVGGPFGLAIGPRGFRGIIETTEHGGYLLLDHLRQILDGPVVWAPGVDGGVVLSLRGGDFLFQSGQDLSIGYSSHDESTVRLYLEESFAFRVTEPEAAVGLRPRGE